MATRYMAIDPEMKNIIVTAISPGWVKTEMGGPQAIDSIETSAEKLWKVISQLKSKDSGSFLQPSGKPLSW